MISFINWSDKVEKNPKFGSPGPSSGMIFLCFRHLIGRASQGTVYWSSWGLLAQLKPLNQPCPLSPARLTCTATSFTAVTEVAGLVFNNSF